MGGTSVHRSELKLLLGQALQTYGGVEVSGGQLLRSGKGGFAFFRDIAEAPPFSPEFGFISTAHVPSASLLVQL